MDHETLEQQKPAENRRSLRLLIGSIVLVTIGLILGIYLSRVASEKAALQVPKTISNQVTFPIYLPKKLPGTYKIDQNSFTYEEDTLIFSASDGTGGRIAFTEQKKPVNFGFDEFYKQQITEPKVINGAPYPSVYGKSTLSEALLVSIVADETWIIVSTESPVGESVESIAQSLKRQE